MQVRTCTKIQNMNMKTNNNFQTLLLIAIVLISCISTAQTNKKANTDTMNWRYEIEAAGQGTQGNYLIKVWSYSRKPVVAIEQAKKNAVHGIIFRGYSGFNSIQGQKPLTNNPNLEMEQEEFFKNFFAD